MKTITFIETDETGTEIEWSEGCISAENIYPHSIELVDKKEAEDIIKQLQERINEMSWCLNPERMGQ